MRSARPQSRSRWLDGAVLALAAAALLALAGCGTRVEVRTVTISSQTHLPTNGAFGIAPVVARPGAPIGCVPHGPLYTEVVTRPTRVVALTFDDGPSEFTHQVLDVLEREQVHATFFVIGDQVTDYPGQLRRALRDGDMIGDHTWTHPDMLTLPIDQALPQLELTMQAIQAATGFTPCFWRAPYGSINTSLEYVARSLGMLSIQWEVDPQDFTVPAASAIVHRVIFGNPHNPDHGVHPGAIVLMHDGGGFRGNTVKALPKTIETLKARGYSFLTIPELLGIPVRRRPT